MNDEDMGLPGPVGDETIDENMGLPPGVAGGQPVQLAAGAGFTPDQRQAQYEAALKNPNVQAFLNTVAQTEGATYDSLYGDTARRPNKFSDYSQFPGDGPDPTASGRYQILKTTYGDASNALGLSDFSPHTQDLMALYLLDRRGALALLLLGDLDAALPGASREWASLPLGPGQAGRYGQHYTPYDKVWSIFDLNRSP